MEGGQGGVRRDPPWAGSRGHGDTRPRVAPGHSRGPGQLRPSAQLSSPAAAHSPWHRHARPRTPWRPSILHRTGARCCRRCCRHCCCRCCCAHRHSAARQSASSWAPSPSPRDRAGSLCYMSLGTLPNTPTHAHTSTSPHPQAGPGANPRCYWDPRIHRYTLKVIAVLHHQVTWRVPNTHGAPGAGAGATPPPGLLRGGAEGLVSQLAPRPVACPSLPPSSQAPRLPSKLGSQPVSASGPIGRRG